MTAAACLIGGTASAFCPYGLRCDDTPPPFSGRTTIQEWGNGMSTIRDGRGNNATVQDWGNGMTTIRGSGGVNTTCQRWGNGMITCN